MNTNHLASTRKTSTHERPMYLPLLTEDDFCKAKYSHNDKRCYTARLLDIFLDERKPFVAAYKEFRLASMDYMYKHHKEDHASSAVERAAGFNAVARQLGYEQILVEDYQHYWKVTLDNIYNVPSIKHLYTIDHDDNKVIGYEWKWDGLQIVCVHNGTQLHWTVYSGMTTPYGTQPVILANSAKEDEDRYEEITTNEDFTAALTTASKDALRAAERWLINNVW